MVRLGFAAFVASSPFLSGRQVPSLEIFASEQIRVGFVQLSRTLPTDAILLTWATLGCKGVGRNTYWVVTRFKHALNKVQSRYTKR